MVKVKSLTDRIKKVKKKDIFKGGPVPIASLGEME